ncbi:hypothetical protein GGR20_003072 [Devosia subaequoris]|uniref:Uncharacterized protein n=1 Tax=Devosia subaequoris TaxID=395930 RepID=A0A7W6NCS3_9HYPH|nr:hypothetical protein [Devosia subaequoris]MBB4053412.1 hypothetical protein [Devosia subaequoris]MCP1210789.1 hypothetical protein [Devosia subaequoris]
MGRSLGISPSIMINRMVYERGGPQDGHLLEVARLRAELRQAQAHNASSPVPTVKPTETPINGAEVDLLI